MFIEKKDSWIYLAKKVHTKKLLVKIDGDTITERLLEELTHKELDIIHDSSPYRDFLENAYNESVLQSIILGSKKMYNYFEVFDVKYLIDDSLVQKSVEVEKWLQFGFPEVFIFNSNNIEWSKIPKEEVKKIIENKKYKYKVKNEVQEVHNSVKSWRFLTHTFVFNEANIKKLYHILTKDLLQENGERYPRGFKKVVNTVNSNITTTPEKVSDEINNLIKWYRVSRAGVFPLQLAFDFHLRYEQIHPFENGNGRTGRFLMNKILIQNGMLPMIVFTDNKQSYFNAIASCKSWNKKKYYKFMLEQYKKTLDQVVI